MHSPATPKKRHPVRNVLLAILGVVVLAALVVSVLAARRPDQFRVERSVVVQAEPARTQAFVDDFHRWPTWSPWEKLDPTMTRTFGGAAKGPGATYAWSGDGKVGAGRMTLTGQTPERIDIAVDFEKPIEGHNRSIFSFAPEGGGTRVTWAMEGPSPFLTKVMGVLMDMDALIGGDFERGLTALKAAAESR